MSDLDFRYVDELHLFSKEKFEKELEKNLDILHTVQQGEAKYADSLGWHRVDEWAGCDWLQSYENLAKKVRAEADALVVIGIGGSNQAARAVYEALEDKADKKLIWFGNTISADSVEKTLKELDSYQNIYIDCIAKNFETLEPGIGFRVMRDYLKARYKDEYNRHVIVTFSEGSKAWKMAEELNYNILPFPLNIGGRYTALSPICLFPLAFAGFDIKALADGARSMEHLLKDDKTISNPALQYASARTELYIMGKRVELLSYFEPRFDRFARWWKQLFGESEGKDDKGLLPMSTCYSEDLHSLGQFVQDGNPILFETFIDIKEQDASYVLKDDEVKDGFHYLNGKDFWDINKAAFSATISAHSKRFPCLIVEIERLNEEAFGSLFYFFAFACYISCLITGVNPFDQDGVETYKLDMFQLLGK